MLVCVKENGVARELKNARGREWKTSAGRAHSLPEKLRLRPDLQVYLIEFWGILHLGLLNNSAFDFIPLLCFMGFADWF